MKGRDISPSVHTHVISTQCGKKCFILPKNSRLKYHLKQPNFGGVQLSAIHQWVKSSNIVRDDSFTECLTPTMESHYKPPSREKNNQINDLDLYEKVMCRSWSSWPQESIFFFCRFSLHILIIFCCVILSGIVN